ncbi:MAG: SIMPL domain-containing protein [Candidatus Omnitrophica bacterium]|nr:SIMPL domain-containing protein [Candidatus Omnitrophota bacterium]MDD4013232.1 SIMPL domain-containing protein [Candidatus Omnitrophota bacterium]
MEGYRILKNTQVIILGVCIAAATIVSSVILSRGFLKLMKFQKEVITVTGSAQMSIKSDYTVWRTYFWREDTDLSAAYKGIMEDLEKVKAYLAAKGVNEDDIIVSQVDTTTIYRKNARGTDTNEIEGYRLTQGLEVRSSDVDKVTEVSRTATDLMVEGIRLESWAPEYFYTGLDELKVEMLARATENAKLRAESMTKATGNTIGAIRSAKMGVFQITPVNSTTVSDWGENDTSSLDKKVTAVVSASFAIE